MSRATDTEPLSSPDSQFHSADNSSSNLLNTTPKTTTFLRLSLSHNTSRLNFVSYLIATLLSICFFVFLNATQGYVLGQLIGVPQELLGDYSGSLSFYDQLLSLLVVYLAGLVSDKLGRRVVYCFGFVFVSFGIYLYPFASNVYPQLLLYRLIFAIGGSSCASMLTAVLADYGSDQDRGKVSGLVGLCSGLGALVALFGFIPLSTTLVGGGSKGLVATYLLVASISLAFSIFLFFGMKPTLSDHNNNKHEIITSSDESHEQYPSLLEIAKQGILAAKDPRILLGYWASFLARGDSVIITLFIPLWVYKHYLSIGECSTGADLEDTDVKKECHSAYIVGSILSGVAQTFALVGAPLFGYISDKVSQPFSILVSGIIGFIGYFWMFMSTDPTSKIMYFVVCLAGLGEIGMVVGGLSLVTRTCIPQQIRGSVAGVSSFFGALGVLFNTKLGGYLFDVWREGAPFLLIAIGHLIACILSLVLLILDYNHLYHDDQRNLSLEEE